MAPTQRVDLEPVTNLRFAVEIQGTVVGWFTECGGLTAERSVYPHREGGVNAYVHQLPGRIKRTHVTLKRGIADEVLWRWFAGEGDEGLHTGKVTRRNVTVILYNTDLTEANRWNIERAYPVRWIAPHLKADGNSAAVEALEIAQGEDGAGTSVQRTVTPEQEGAAGKATQQGSSDEDIDLTALADRVHALLKQEMRLERERLGQHRMG